MQADGLARVRAPGCGDGPDSKQLVSRCPSLPPAGQHVDEEHAKPLRFGRAREASAIQTLTPLED
jgi:hypothetical protein